MPVYALGDRVPTIHPEAIHPDAVVIGSVIIGTESSVRPTAVLRGDSGRIEIGERTSIQDGTIVHTTEQWATVIGSCLIGFGSVVLNRAVVRTGSVVAAQAPAGPGVDRTHGALTRMGLPDMVTPLVVCPAGEQSGYSTGAEFVVDGGVTAGVRYA
ncbi:carbonic anhydrase/acetyltransferase-like protein (isoleucine patch superfamily) [Thermocatellispora tengchongensis]|uniref:Carbonic anhydrase/acetyltransferase-like protein (Isoleucine patch superfamily) n=1 Tax=Thermocatellispora tengchongensis TaxID=1073253 RepID=A0A840PRT0_9ACTN|nr:gamma carbonic anhydrase family protein [Thermocatellispora tengchongensis]MBB5139817.1 carbonic anhydrase/acetyltransferase-like protein (isoleucine patch superfamily) [Thermocatellispora tengchongensis]